MTAHGLVTYVKLAFPIEHGGRTISEVSLRRPRVADMLEMQRKGGDAATMELTMVAMLTGLPVEAVTELDMQDYNTILAALRGFSAT